MLSPMFSKKKVQVFCPPSPIDPHWINQNLPQIKNAILNGNFKWQSPPGTFNSPSDQIFIQHLHQFALSKNRTIHFPGISPTLLDQVSDTSISKENPSNESSSFLLTLGNFGIEFAQEFKGHLFLLSEALYRSTWGIFKPKTLLAGSGWAQVYQLGYQALPIVLLLNFLIGLTLAIQSTVQLEKFGASMYLASGIAVSMVAEIGPLITAVILAGRSGSAITAEIASMTVNEEIKALQTMDIHILDFLLLPRFWALTLMVPLLTICADIMGIFAGFLISTFYAGIAPNLFLKELLEALDLTLIFQSLLKTVVFAWIIALIAVYRGIHVQGGATSVGKATTACVVYSIFCIILADAFFSFIFYV